MYGGTHIGGERRCNKTVLYFEWIKNGNSWLLYQLDQVLTRFYMILQGDTVGQESL